MTTVRGARLTPDERTAAGSAFREVHELAALAWRAVSRPEAQRRHTRADLEGMVTALEKLRDVIRQAEVAELLAAPAADDEIPEHLREG